jgi:hypothetical protein
MRALNIPRDLVARIGEQGWNEIPAEARAGLSDPAPAQPDYLFALAEVYRLKAAHQGGSAVAEDAGERGALPTDEGFLHFVDAQLSWDRAMAEGLVAARRAYPEALVVGIMGRGHVDSGYGVPHQLTDLGETSVVSLVPVDVGEPCRTMPPDLADAAFTVPAVRNFHASPPRPRLGVTLEATEGGLAVVDVQAQGVGAAAGLEAGDVIFEAAGLPVAGTGQLRAVLARQAWGTWLPLAVRREGHVLELVARFPPRVHDLDAAPDH